MNKSAIRLSTAQSKEEINQALLDITTRCSDTELRAEITALRTRLLNQAAGEDAELMDIDEDIKGVVKELSADLAKGSLLVARSRIQKISLLLDSRAEICPLNTLTATKSDRKKQAKVEKARLKRRKLRLKLQKKGKSTVETYSAEELIDIMLRNYIDEKTRLTEQAQAIHDALIANPEDAYMKARWTPVQLKLKAVNEAISDYGKEANREAAVAAMQQMDAGYKEILTRRKVSNEELEKIRKEHARIMEEKQKDAAVIDEMTSDIMNGASLRAEGVISSSATADSVFNDPAFIALGKADSSKKEEISENSGEILKRVEDIISDIDAELDKTDYERKRYATQIRNLLARRRELPEFERLVVNGQIDSAHAVCEGLERKMSVLRNAKSNLIEKRTFITNVQLDGYMKEIRKLLPEFGSEDTLQDIAVDIAEGVEAANSELETMGTINAVAGSTEVRTSSLSGERHSLTDAGALDDEEKYAEFEKKYGVV